MSSAGIHRFEHIPVMEDYGISLQCIGMHPRLEVVFCDGRLMDSVKGGGGTIALPFIHDLFSLLSHPVIFYFLYSECFIGMMKTCLDLHCHMQQ